MSKRTIYIIISILIIALIAGLIGWSVYVGRQQQELQRDTEDLGFFGTGGSGSGGGGIFGGLFGDSRETVSGEPQAPQPVLRQLYNLPTAGYIKRRSEAIRFVDRATGHVFERELPAGESTRVYQTTVPQVYEAVFTDDGRAVTRRYVDDNDAVVSVYNRTSVSANATSSPTTSNLAQLVANPDGDKIAYIEETGVGSSIAVSNPDFTEEVVLFSSTIRGWNIEWNAPNTLLVIQKPASGLPSSAYILDVTTGERSLAVQQASGLSGTLSPNGEKVLYSSVQSQDFPLLFVRNVSTGTTTDLSTATFAEKCTWDAESAYLYCAVPNTFPTATYPDAWLQGLVHFNDTIWRIHSETGIAEPIISPSTAASVSLDITHLSLSAQGDEMFFINNTDQTLWSVTLPDISETSTSTDTDDTEVGDEESTTATE